MRETVTKCDRKRCEAVTRDLTGWFMVRRILPDLSTGFVGDGTVEIMRADERFVEEFQEGKK